MSFPNDSGRPSTFNPGRPASSRRPRTGIHRPNTARPDTGASGIGELPDQQFFAEGEEFDEEDEYDDDEAAEAGENPSGVFAFARPATAVPPQGWSGYSASGYTGSVSPSGLHPTTAGTFASIATFGNGAPLTPNTAPLTPNTAPVTPNFSDVPPPTGNMDAGGHLPELEYDSRHPSPMRGTRNLNNSSFAFMDKLQNLRGEDKGKRGNERRPPTGRSLFDKLHRRMIASAGTDATGASDTNLTTDFSERRASVDDSDAMSFKTETSASRPVMQTTRRMRSSAPLIPGSNASDFTSEVGTQRGMSRGSYGLTEMTGDMTVPDGKTTWGDGLGGMIKRGADENSLAPIDLDVIEEDSPYPEVRASVSNLDDPEMPSLTLRSWTLGMFFSAIGTAINVFFRFRTPSPYISPLIVQVVAYPVGKFFAYVLPIRERQLPRWLGGARFSLNPGPFNIKEHSVIVIMTNASVSPAYALYMTVSSELWYKHNFGIGFSILFVLTTQVSGFALAGLCRRFVIYPASMIWPGNLVITTNLNVLHAEDEGYTGGISRFKFFIIGASAAFAWYFLPGFLFTALSYFSYACWIAPNNHVVNELFGTTMGLGMGILTFDWSQINWFGSPLTTPWWAELNIALGFIVFYWILVPILYYNNVWQSSYLPMNVIQAGDRFGNEYDVFNILNPDLTLNKTAYAEYSPVYLSACFSMTYMLAFALSTALIVHTMLHHGPRIYATIARMKSEADDVHMKLMRNYPEAPDWWFLIMFAVCFVFAVVAIEVFHTGLPFWGYVIATIIPVVYVLPAAFVYAMTSQTVATNLISELIPGYLFQGQPIQGMVFKVFSLSTLSEALNFLQDQKLGHYMKIPPRTTFIAQLSACTVTCLVQVATKELLFATVKDICGNKTQDLLTCNNFKVFFTSSVIWGLIGPERIFSKGSVYYPQVYAALIGAIIPIPLWFWVRKYPRSILRNWNTPVILNGGLQIPPATGVNYSSWFVTGFIFQFWIRRRHFAWWSKYNYVLSAALDVGTALSALFIFFALDLPGVSVKWWGNTVYQNTLDWSGNSALRLVPENGFGPRTWKV